MGTHLNCLIEAVLNFTHNQCFSARFSARKPKKEFSPEIFNFSSFRKNLYTAKACFRNKSAIILECHGIAMRMLLWCDKFNPYLMNGPAHHYHLGESSHY